MTDKEHLISYFHELEAVKTGNFTLRSGQTSNIYVDCRKVTLYRASLRLICLMVEERLEDYDIDSVGGPTLGADPIVAGLLIQGFAQQGFLIRKAVKGHGLQKQIEGTVGKRPALVEDVVMTGESLKRCCELAKPVVVCAVVSRGSVELPCPFFSLLTLEDLL